MPDALNFYSFKAQSDFPIDRSQRGNSSASPRVALPVLLSTTSGVRATERLNDEAIHQACLGISEDVLICQKFLSDAADGFATDTD